MNRKQRRAAAKQLGKALRAQGVSKAQRRAQVLQARKGISFASKAESTLAKAISTRQAKRSKRAAQPVGRVLSAGQKRAQETELLNRVHSGDWKVGSFLQQASYAWKESGEYAAGDHQHMMSWLSEEAQRRGFSSLTAWEQAFEKQNSKLLGLTEENEVLYASEDPYLTGMQVVNSLGFTGYTPTLPKHA